jgi:hypothetical protein
MQEFVSSATRSDIIESTFNIKEGFCHEEKTREKSY